MELLIIFQLMIIIILNLRLQCRGIFKYLFQPNLFLLLLMLFNH